MSRMEKGIHRLFISLVFSLLNWIIIDNLIVELSVGKYIIVEIILVISMKFSIFTIRKFNLHDKHSSRH